MSGTIKVWFYIALYPVRWTAQSALHFPPLADLFIPTPFSASLGSIHDANNVSNVGGDPGTQLNFKNVLKM